MRGLVTHFLLKEIYTGFNKEQISIPFPQMDVHVTQAGSDENTQLA